MDLLNNPQIHSTFASLGNMMGDSFVPTDECLTVLDEINYKLSMEDTTLRTYRRAIGFAQNVEKDIMPLLMNMKDQKVIDSIIRLLIKLTVPIEYLFSVGAMSRTEIGRHTIYDLHRLLLTCKEAFVNFKAIKAIVDHMNALLKSDCNELSIAQCDSINNCILLLRNILHISENESPSQHIKNTSMQNQIIWNLFTLHIDKLLLQLMKSSHNSYWNINIVQVIALLYKDQHVGNLQKLLNHWIESSALSDTSEDNESNTSPQRPCCNLSPMMTSNDPTSDSSDNGIGRMTEMSTSQLLLLDSGIQLNSRNKGKMCSNDESFDSMLSSTNSDNSNSEYFNQDISMKSVDSVSHNSDISSKSSSSTSSSNHKVCIHHKKSCNKNQQTPHIGKTPQTSSDNSNSDAGYTTQLSQAGDIIPTDKVKVNMSASSSDDDNIRPIMKSQHQKPLTSSQKQRLNPNQMHNNVTGIPTQQNPQDNNNNSNNSVARRKKLVKRSKCSIINVKGIITHTPTDDDITNILKEFAVDFLLKGFDNLVLDLHAKLTHDPFTGLDVSHFSWLVTYFLKFAAELEVDLEHIRSVLTFDVISYLTYEGVHVCEQLEITSRQEGTDLTPYLRRNHLVVAAIREFLQALEMYKNCSHLSRDDRDRILTLQLQIGSTEDLRHLFVLLLRCYNPKIQSLSYLQDLIVTNHILLLLLDNTSKHLQQTIPKSCPYTFQINDHISQFATVDIMNHYGTLLDNFQDNGEYVNDCIFTMIHHVGGDLNEARMLFQPIFLKTFSKILESDFEVCEDWADLIEYVINKFVGSPLKKPEFVWSSGTDGIVSICDVWAQEEMDTLYWYYMQSKSDEDIVGSIIKKIKESGRKGKSRIAVTQQLLQQDIIQFVEYDELMKFEDVKNDDDNSKVESGIIVAECSSESTTSTNQDDVKMLLDRLLNEKKGKLVFWIQQALIECCYIKLNLSNENQQTFPIMEPISHHCILNKQPVPLIPFNSEQNKILVYQPFVLLLHKLGFILPADANRLFVRIPDFWSMEDLLKVAETLGPIPKNCLKFDIDMIKKKLDFETSDIASTVTSYSGCSEQAVILDQRFMPDVQTKVPGVSTMMTNERAVASLLPQKIESTVSTQPPKDTDCQQTEAQSSNTMINTMECDDDDNNINQQINSFNLSRMSVSEHGDI